MDISDFSFAVLESFFLWTSGHCFAQPQKINMKPESRIITHESTAPSGACAAMSRQDLWHKWAMQVSLLSRPLLKPHVLRWYYWEIFEQNRDKAVYTMKKLQCLNCITVSNTSSLTEVCETSRWDTATSAKATCHGEVEWWGDKIRVWFKTLWSH